MAAGTFFATVPSFSAAAAGLPFASPIVTSSQSLVQAGSNYAFFNIVGTSDAIASTGTGTTALAAIAATAFNPSCIAIGFTGSRTADPYCYGAYSAAGVCEAGYVPSGSVFAYAASAGQLAALSRVGLTATALFYTGGSFSAFGSYSVSGAAPQPGGTITPSANSLAVLAGIASCSQGAYFTEQFGVAANGAAVTNSLFHLYIAQYLSVPPPQVVTPGWLPGSPQPITLPCVPCVSYSARPF